MLPRVRTSHVGMQRNDPPLARHAPRVIGQSFRAEESGLRASIWIPLLTDPTSPIRPRCCSDQPADRRHDYCQ